MGSKWRTTAKEKLRRIAYALLPPSYIPAFRISAVSASWTARRRKNASDIRGAAGSLCAQGYLF